MDYEIIYSKRRTLSIQVTPDSRVIVRSPYKVRKDVIASFIKSSAPWIEKKLAILESVPSKPTYNECDIPLLKAKTKEIVLDRVKHFSSIMGLSPKRVSVNSAKKRFGSCSAEGNINFSFRLCLYPNEVIDYVVVHELAHLKELNHSRRFWAIVEKYIPNYKEIKKQFR